MKKMYFGTREKMQWVKCPATNISRNRAKWQETGAYLNGGAFSATSAYSHMEYNIAWNLMASEEAAKIMSYFEGVHGDGLIHFLEPFAKKSNVLPLHWSVPRLCAKDAPNLLPAGSARPSEVPARVEVRRNYITNPRGAVSTGWSVGSNCAAVYSEPGAVFTHAAGTIGNGYFRVPLAALAASTTYALRFEAEQVAGDATLVARVADSFDTVAGATVVKTGSRFLITTTFTTGTTPPANPYLILDFVGEGTGEQVRSLGGTVEVGTVAGAPFDGSTSPDPALLPAWIGTPSASPSILISDIGGGRPATSAQFTVAGTDGTNPTIYVPVPPGENFYMEVCGVAGGSAGVRVIPDRGSAVTLAPTALETPATTVLTNPGGVTLRFAGTGTFTLNSMRATVGTSAPDYSVFRQGEGNSGVRFNGNPTRTGYSSALDLESVTAEFVEVGAWL